MNWMQRYIPMACIVIGLFAAVFVLISWGIGYYANALYDYKFEINSCWQGFTAMGVGLVGLLTWVINSVWNSKKEEPPQ